MNDLFTTRRTHESAELVHRLLEFDSLAWRQFMEVYSPVIRGWARSAGLQPCDIADVTQEVFGVVAKRLETFEPREAERSFHPWLWSITRNILRQFFRRVRRQPQATGGVDSIRLLEDVIDPIDEPGDIGQRERVNRQVNHAVRAVRNDFHEKTWQAFWRMTINRETASAIAADLDMNARAVRQAKFRVITRLRDELSAYQRPGNPIMPETRVSITAAEVIATQSAMV